MQKTPKITYMVLQPNSNTNPTDKYRVVDYDKWIDFRQGTRTRLDDVGEYRTYAEADRQRNTMNHAVNGK